ncbi:hypothetical protein C8Q80DRAFT_267660 [Daedaleopsis nitida]|nr:hypothetical protein C8Q80DRAFT_267660 [Daedaleopsis nitida]
MQEHLANTVKEPRSNQHREGASAPDSKSQATTLSATIPALLSRDKALHPGATSPPPSDDSVPSLLSRLSDPVAPCSVVPQNTTASDGHPGSGRETLSVPQGGRPVSVADTVARTRARPARTSAGEDRSAAASRLRPPTQHPGPAGRDSTAKQAAGGTGDVGASGGAPVGGHMSSASEEISVHPRPRRGQSATLFCQFASPASCRAPCPVSFLMRSSPAGGAPSPSPSPSATGGGGAPSSDPRFLLVQKLELEKRRARAAAVPTAEKAQLQLQMSPVAAGGAALPASPSAAARRMDGEGVQATEPAPAAEGVAAERSAERREAELRSQAQLRVRLAAAKRAAMGRAPGASTSAADIDTPSGTNFSEGSAGASLVSQEMVLQSKLRTRKA